MVILMIGGRSMSYEVALKWTSLDLTNDKINIGLGNVLVPSGNKPLPDPMLTKIYVAVGRH